MKNTSLAFTHVDLIIPLQVGAAEIGISSWTLRRAGERGEIEFIRVSKRRLGVRRSELNRYLSERVVRHDKG